MCDYSLQMVKSRPAVVGDKLVTKSFGTGTTGFCAHDDRDVAVCVLPGTELSFAEPIATVGSMAMFPAFISGGKTFEHRVAIFRQIRKDEPHCHHDALELPSGRLVLLTALKPDQWATVLQMPVARTPAELKEIQRIPISG